MAANFLGGQFFGGSFHEGLSSQSGNFFGGQFFGGDFFGASSPQVVTQPGTIGSRKTLVFPESKLRRLLEQLRKKKLELKKVEKQIVVAEKKVEKEQTEGILANLARLEVRSQQIETAIETLETKIYFPVIAIAFDDEDDIEVLLLDS